MPDEQNQAYNDATQLVVNAVKRAIRTRWETAFRDGFKQKMLDMVLEATIPQVAALEKMVAGLAASFLSDRTGHKVTQLDDSSRTSQDDIRQGIINAFITGRAAVKDGVSADEAIAQSLNQLLTFVDTGAETAKIKQSQNSLIEAGWQRYKRVAHPGESESGSCALCLIASTRVYYIEDLLPIHTNCHCDVDTIQDGDITIVDGKEYVGLRDLKIPEDMMTIGPHANPDSMQTRLKTYLQDMDKRQFQSGLQAWEQTISVDMSPTNSGGLPRLQYKSQNDKTLNVSMAAPKARKTQPSKPTEVKTLSRRAGLTRTIEDFKAKYPNLQMKDFENSVQLLRNRFKRLDPDNLKAVEETMRDFLLGLDRVYSISPKAASMNVYQTNKGTTIKVNEVQGATAEQGGDDRFRGVLLDEVSSWHVRAKKHRHKKQP